MKCPHSGKTRRQSCIPWCRRRKPSIRASNDTAAFFPPDPHERRQSCCRSGSEDFRSDAHARRKSRVLRTAGRSSGGIVHNGSDSRPESTRRALSHLILIERSTCSAAMGIEALRAAFPSRSKTRRRGNRPRRSAGEHAGRPIRPRRIWEKTGPESVSGPVLRGRYLHLRNHIRYGGLRLRGRRRRRRSHDGISGFRIPTHKNICPVRGRSVFGRRWGRARETRQQSGNHDWNSGSEQGTLEHDKRLLLH